MKKNNLSKQKKYLTSLLQNGHEVIVVDGGSSDKTVTIAKHIGCKTIITKPSRGHQLHTGALEGCHDTLVFLHADTFLPTNSTELINKSLEASQKHWGRFDVQFSNTSYIFRVIAYFYEYAHFTYRYCYR